MYEAEYSIAEREGTMERNDKSIRQIINLRAWIIIF